MTIISDSFKWDGPQDDDGTPVTAPHTVLGWEQTKVIVEELNRREPERMAVFNADVKSKAAQLTDSVPDDVDLGGAAILAGCVAALINETRDGERPKMLDLVIQLICSQVVPENLIGPFLHACAVNAARKFQPRSEQPAKVDDETADRINALLDGLRRKGGHTIN